MTTVLQVWLVTVSEYGLFLYLSGCQNVKDFPTSICYECKF